MSSWIGYATLVAVLAAGLHLAPPALGQGLEVGLSNVDGSRHPDVAVSISALGPQGEAIADLDQATIEVSEDKIPATVKECKADRSPLAIALVIDSSRAMGASMAAVLAAVGKLLDALRPADLVMVVSVSGPPITVEPLSTDRKKTKMALMRLTARGAPHLWDGLAHAITALNGRGARVAALLVTGSRNTNIPEGKPGLVSAPVYTPKALAMLARDRQTPIWAVGIGAGVDRAVLPKLAVATGGHAFLRDDAGSFGNDAKRITTALSTLFRLTYRAKPGPARSPAHRVVATVRLNGQQGAGRTRYVVPVRAATPEPAAVYTEPDRPVEEVVPVERFQGNDQNPYQ